MDNFDSGNPGSQNFNEPIPLDRDLDKPIPFDSVGAGETGVSHAPLDLGGGGTVPTPTVGAPKPATKPTASVLQREKPTAKIASADRIVGMKAFFTKLHAGAIAFLEEQIARWLKENPDVIVKRTNVVTGDVVGKKTEPNIVITIWY